jgi:hypothetical protein
LWIRRKNKKERNAGNELFSTNQFH